jgi:hypothetical protein
MTFQVLLGWNYRASLGEVRQQGSSFRGNCLSVAMESLGSFGGTCTEVVHQDYSRG